MAYVTTTIELPQLRLGQLLGCWTFSDPVILLAGGYDKLSFAEMAREIHNRAKAVIVLVTQLRRSKKQS